MKNVTSLLRHCDEDGLLWGDGRCSSVEFAVPRSSSVPRSSDWKWQLGPPRPLFIIFFLKRTSVEVCTSVEVHTSVKVFTNPRSRYYNLDRGLINNLTEIWTSVEVWTLTEGHLKKNNKKGPRGPQLSFSNTRPRDRARPRDSELNRGTATIAPKQPILITMSEQRGNIFQLEFNFFFYKFIKFDKCIFL